jgi:hypothetical protein
MKTAINISRQPKNQGMGLGLVITREYINLLGIELKQKSTFQVLDMMEKQTGDAGNTTTYDYSAFIVGISIVWMFITVWKRGNVC